MNPILATASNSTGSLPPLDLSWAITTAIAIVAFLSPIVVSVINNRHARIIRKMDIDHLETLKKMDCRLALTEKQFDIYYADKKTAFSEFLHAAGNFSMHKAAASSYAEVNSALTRALLFCDKETQESLLHFLNFIDNAYGGSSSRNELTDYSKQLTEIAIILNDELASTKPTSDCRQTE